MSITINGSGSITGLVSGGLPDGSVTAADLADTYLTPTGDGSGLTGITTGKVLQVVTSNVTTIQSVSSTGYAHVSALDLSITPSSTSSKIMIMYGLTCCTTGNSYCPATILRGGTDLKPTGSGTGIDGMFWINDWNTSYSSYRAKTVAYSYIDSPNTTSATTYKLYVRPQIGSGYVFYLNQALDRVDSNQLRQGVSTVTLMEIGA